jgi:hypothetical protein
MRTKQTVSEGKPRDAGAHGKTLEMKAITRPEPEFIHEHAPAVKVAGGRFVKPRGLIAYIRRAGK